ncbi:alpha/beta fold hydrolase [Acidobacterium sp. S8]|uniref:alpha/beta fold hydrolase n=1 Tax=Acidobacterium sp. S8 TaxID=1641854 RepID=UPI00131B46EB|nr:alpha/beta hydrolase [Acidobacterium sp. S8]
MYLTRCGSGEPILFIHGMPTNGRLWNKIIERLCGRYTCFTVDLPGLGKTPRAQYGPEYLRKLAEQIEALRLQNGIVKWHVVGHDAGSAVAVHYAHFFQPQVDCMVLLSPALFPELEPYFLIEPLRTPVLGEVLAPVVQALFWKIAMRRAIGDEPSGAEMVNEFHAPFTGPAGPWRFMKLMRWGKPSQLLAQVPAFLPQLLMPTLIFQGSHDAAIPESFARRAASLLPNAGMVMLDSGHFIPLHQPESVASSLVRFFETRSPQMSEYFTT